MKFSILDLAPVTEEGSVAEALHHSARLRSFELAAQALIN